MTIIFNKSKCGSVAENVLARPTTKGTGGVKSTQDRIMENCEKRAHNTSVNVHSGFQRGKAACRVGC